MLLQVVYGSAQSALLGILPMLGSLLAADMSCQMAMGCKAGLLPGHSAGLSWVPTLRPPCVYLMDCLTMCMTLRHCTPAWPHLPSWSLSPEPLLSSFHPGRSDPTLVAMKICNLCSSPSPLLQAAGAPLPRAQGLQGKPNRCLRRVDCVSCADASALSPLHTLLHRLREFVCISNCASQRSGGQGGDPAVELDGWGGARHGEREQSWTAHWVPESLTDCHHSHFVGEPLASRSG